MKKYNFVYYIICILFICSCTSKTNKSGDSSQQTMSTDDAKYVLEYYNSTLSFTSQLVNSGYIDSILNIMDSRNPNQVFPDLYAPTMNSTDTTYLTNPGSPFTSEVKKNLIINYRRLFKSVSAFFENYNTYKLYMSEKKYKEDNYALADNIRNDELALSISIPEYQSVIYDILTPWVINAKEVIETKQ